MSNPGHFKRPIEVGDIVDIHSNRKSTGLYIVNDIQPGHTSTGWSVEFELVNSERMIGVAIKANLLLRTEHLAGEEFTINGDHAQIILITGGVITEPEKVEAKEEIIRLF